MKRSFMNFKIGLIVLIGVFVSVTGYAQIRTKPCPQITTINGSAACFKDNVRLSVGVLNLLETDEVRWEFSYTGEFQPNGAFYSGRVLDYDHELTAAGSFLARVTIIPNPIRYFLSHPEFPIDCSPVQMVTTITVGANCPPPPPDPNLTCPKITSIRHSRPCPREPLALCVNIEESGDPTVTISSIEWTLFTDNGSRFTDTGPSIIHSDYLPSGNFTAQVLIRTGSTTGGTCNSRVFTASKTIPIPQECAPDVCVDCTRSFVPMPGKSYILSAWVKEKEYTVLPYVKKAGIRLNFQSVCAIPNISGLSSAMAPVFKAEGPVIEGWQRIEGEFSVPLFANNVSLELFNEGSSEDVFFDDIRIFPTDANMRTFVFDPATHRLMAENDENNYAVFYEYDEEGNLVRTEVETERGIKTINESRQHLTQTTGN